MNRLGDTASFKMYCLPSVIQPLITNVTKTKSNTVNLRECL